METMVLQQYILDAERAFEQNEYMEGMRFLEDALTIEPQYGKAHNHMGWLYLVHLDDMVKAEKHIAMALKYSPSYSPAYLHMSHILFETQRFDELGALLKQALKVGGVKKSFIFNEFGRMNEVVGHFRKAVEQYKLAIKWCFDERELMMIKDNIKRCRQKRWTLMF
ncbi:MAG: hypothetical protein K9H64_04215 [Bacteroidales bacterium]|nr:hypothetical protein [Bacteroidales bacterium]MCF8455028.1 hypothetical protein [Bacteroidales bacterium]